MKMWEVHSSGVLKLAYQTTRYQNLQTTA